MPDIPSQMCAICGAPIRLCPVWLSDRYPPIKRAWVHVEWPSVYVHAAWPQEGEDDAEQEQVGRGLF